MGTPAGTTRTTSARGLQNVVLFSNNSSLKPHCWRQMEALSLLSLNTNDSSNFSIWWCQSKGMLADYHFTNSSSWNVHSKSCWRIELKEYLQVYIHFSIILQWQGHLRLPLVHDDAHDWPWWFTCHCLSCCHIHCCTDWRQYEMLLNMMTHQHSTIQLKTTAISIVVLIVELHSLCLVLLATTSLQHIRQD